MSVQLAETSLRQINPHELISNPTLLRAIALSYLAVFNPKSTDKVESTFQDDHKLPDVEARIIAQTHAEDIDNTQHAHLIIATTPWDESTHYEEDGYIVVTDAATEFVPYAVIGCLFTEGDAPKNEVMTTVIATASMFLPSEQAKIVENKVQKAFKDLPEKMFERLLYIPELWVRKAYRGVGLQLMKKLGDLVMQDGKLVKDEILFWTDQTSQMYEIMKEILGGRDFYILTEKRLLMKGSCTAAYAALHQQIT